MIKPGEFVQTRIRPMELKDVQRVHQIDVASFALPWPERSYRFEILENPASHNFVIEVVPDDQEPGPLPWKINHEDPPREGEALL